MRIAIICDPIDLDQKTGIPVYCKNLIKNLIKIDKKNTYIFFHSKKNIILKGQKEIILNSNFKYFILNQLYIIWKKFILIPYFLRKNKIDIVHELNMFTPCSFDLTRKYLTVTTVFDLSPIIYSKLHNFINVLGFNLFFKLSLKSSNKIISISNATKKDVIKIFPFFKEQNIVTTYLGTNIKNIKEDNTIKYDFPFILSVGTLEPRKNLIILIKAFIELKEKKQIKEKLILVGKKGWKIQGLFEELKLNTKYSSDIILTGFISDEQLLYLYKTCRVFVYPSLYEGFGLPVLEAMTIGVPVITSNKSSLPEIVGKKGTTIDPNNYKDLMDKLYLILYDDKSRNNNIKNGLERANLFSWEKCAKETIKVYEKLYINNTK